MLLLLRCPYSVYISNIILVYCFAWNSKLTYKLRTNCHFCCYYYQFRNVYNFMSAYSENLCAVFSFALFFFFVFFKFTRWTQKTRLQIDFVWILYVSHFRVVGSIKKIQLMKSSLYRQIFMVAIFYIVMFFFSFLSKHTKKIQLFNAIRQRTHCTLHTLL